MNKEWGKAKDHLAGMKGMDGMKEEWLHPLHPLHPGQYAFAFNG
jgi:hypothetical protein